MADPWAQFAEAPAEHPPAPEAGGDFAQFAQSTPSGTSSSAYLQELQRRFDAGQSPEQLSAYVHEQGFDPSATDFARAVTARAAGDRVRFVPNGAVQVTPNDGSAGGVAHDASVAGTGFVHGGIDALSQLETMSTPVGMARAAANAVLERFGYHFPNAAELLHAGTQALDIGTPHSQGERYLAAGAAGLGSGLASGGRNVAGVALNALSGTASGVAGQAAAESGFGAVGQTIASLAAGLGVNGMAAAARHLPIPRRAAAIAETVPHEIAVDPAGHLTAEGHELALRAEVPDEEVAMAYARARRSRGGGSHQTARETARNRDRSLDQPLPDNAPVSRAPEPDTTLPSRTTALVNGIRERVENGGIGGNGSGGEPPAPPPIFNEAADERIPLTRGQAEQNFEVQNDENALRVSATREGEQARQWFNGQQTHIQAAIGRLRARFGPDAGNAADRGKQVQQAVRDLRDAGAEGVRALYRQAEELGGEGLRLNTRGIHDAATDVLIDEAVPEPVKRAVSQELARYGIIGTAEPTNEAGITRVTLDDGSTVSFRGPVKQLTAANAEDLRRAVNRLYDPTKPNLTGQSIKPAIDQALEESLASAADGTGPVSGAYREARAAYQGQRRTFHANDIIQSLHANKNGTNTPVLLPERAIAQVIGAGANGVTNLRTTKALLLSSGTDSARQAWRAIQHQGLADIFDSALSRNVNHGAGQIGDVVSGAKLNSAIDRFGVDKLRILLSPEDFNGLMKLRRIIGAATIPISGTTNPGGTATKIINYMRQGTLRFAGAIPGVGHTVNAFAGLAAKGKEIAATRRTLEGVTSYTGPGSSSAMDRAAQQFVRDFIDSGTSGALVPATVTLNQREARR